MNAVPYTNARGADRTKPGLIETLTKGGSMTYSNIYYGNHESIKLVDSTDRAGYYEFDIFAIFEADGRLYYASDSGCSCPMPFEDYHTVGDLSGGTVEDVQRGFDAWLGGDSSYRTTSAGERDRIKQAIRSWAPSAEGRPEVADAIRD